jgi:dihydroorotase
VALLLKGGHLVDPAAGLDRVADVVIRDGVVVETGEDLKIPKGETIDCTGKIVLPGLIDLHVHLREPGREDEETVASGTRAAAHGGFTAVCAMPNTSPVADEGAAIAVLARRAADTGVARVYPLGAISVGQKGQTLAEMGDMLSAGAVAFSDDGHGVQDSGLMRRAMDYAKMFPVAVVSHCEENSLAGHGVVNEGVVSTRMGLPGHTAAAEEVMVARDIRLAELTGCRLHLAHVSTAGSVELVRRAKAQGVPVTCEVTPHHLFLTEDDITDYDTNFKMNPPLRTASDAAALLTGLLDGTVDAIATDHAPHAPHEKELEFELAPFGTTGLETALSLVVTHLVEPGKAAWADVVRWMCLGPRTCIPLLPDVTLAAGSPADVTVVDPEARVTVTRDWFESRSANSAFLGARLLGRASEVLVGGRIALRHGKVVG